MPRLPIIGALARSHDELAALLARLDATPEDSAAVLRAMPSPGDGDAWSLSERGRQVLVRGMLGRDSVAEPLPELPGLAAARVILATMDDILRRHQEFGIPDEISWKTLALLGQAMSAYR